MSFNEKLAEVQEDQRSSSEALYDITTKVCQIFDDPEFRAESGCSSDAEAAAWIDRQIVFSAWGSPKFLDMKAILAKHPNRSEWHDGDIKSWLAEVREAQAKRPQS